MGYIKQIQYLKKSNYCVININLIKEDEIPKEFKNLILATEKSKYKREKKNFNKFKTDLYK